MGVLLEAKSPNPQVVRLVNGPANGRQGNDFKLWKTASWLPCSALRKTNKKPDPPVTWKFGPYAPRDNRANALGVGQHFIQKYGVSHDLYITFGIKQLTLNSSSSILKRNLAPVGVSSQYTFHFVSPTDFFPVATFSHWTLNAQNGRRQFDKLSTVSDHGFRGNRDDPYVPLTPIS